MIEEPNNHLLVLSPSELLGKIVKDLYFGNGKPALTIRIAGVEEQQAMFKDALDKQAEWQNKINMLILGTLISSVGGLIAIIFVLIRH